MRQERGRGRIVQQIKEGGRVRVREVEMKSWQEEIRRDGSKAGKLESRWVGQKQGRGMNHQKRIKPSSQKRLLFLLLPPLLFLELDQTRQTRILHTRTRILWR